MTAFLWSIQIPTLWFIAQIGAIVVKRALLNEQLPSLRLRCLDVPERFPTRAVARLLPFAPHGVTGVAERSRASHLQRLARHLPVSRQRPGAIAFVRLPFIGKASVVEGVRGIALALGVVSDDLDAPGRAVSHLPVEAMNEKELSR